MADRLTKPQAGHLQGIQKTLPHGELTVRKAHAARAGEAEQSDVDLMVVGTAGFAVWSTGSQMSKVAESEKQEGYWRPSHRCKRERQGSE